MLLNRRIGRARSRSNTTPESVVLAAVEGGEHHCFAEKRKAHPENALFN